MNSNNPKKTAAQGQPSLSARIGLLYLPHLQDAPQLQFSQVQTSQLQIALLHFGWLLP